MEGSNTTTTTTIHPAAMESMRLQDDLPALERAIRTGRASAYPLDVGDIHIPPSKIKGRYLFSTGHGDREEGADGRARQPAHFTGKIQVETGIMRIDHSQNTELWLEVNLGKEMAELRAWRAHPDHPSNKEAL